MKCRNHVIREFVAAQPTPPRFLRLPMVRHIRAIVATMLVNRHYSRWARMGYFPSNSDLDYAVCDAIWRGEK